MTVDDRHPRDLRTDGKWSCHQGVVVEFGQNFARLALDFFFFGAVANVGDDVVEDVE